jgi:two-component system CheB/CheR fusion protein
LTQRKTVGVQGVRMAGRDGDVLVNMTVKPVLSNSFPPRGYFVVLFEELAVPPNSVRQLAGPASSGSTYTDDELVRVREQLRVTVEQYETERGGQVGQRGTAGDERGAPLSAEELETSKEELQSVNEELTPSTRSSRSRSKSSGSATATSEPDQRDRHRTIFLDRALRLKLATPRTHESSTCCLQTSAATVGHHPPAGVRRSAR